MPARGTVFPDIAPTEYYRQPELLQNRVEVPFGDPQINVPHPFVKNFFRWNSTFLTPADLVTLETWFYGNPPGTAPNALTYFSLYEAPGWGNLAIPPTLVGTIVGGQMTYTLPGKELAGLVLYDDNVATVINASRYSIAAGAGSEGEDQITFAVGQLPTAGHKLFYTATSGRKKYTVWCNTKRFPSAYSGEGDLFTLETPLEFEERIT